MNGNSAILSESEESKCMKRIIQELRGLLLLGLKYTQGENANFITANTHIRESLDKLENIENLLK